MKFLYFELGLACCLKREEVEAEGAISQRYFTVELCSSPPKRGLFFVPREETSSSQFIPYFLGSDFRRRRRDLLLPCNLCSWEREVYEEKEKERKKETKSEIGGISGDAFWAIHGH